MEKEMKSETVIEMVRRRIVELGHEGLVSKSRECACDLSDLAPCGDMAEDCESGVKEPCGAGCWSGGGCDFHITAVES